MKKQWDLLMLVDGQWESIGRFDDQEELDAMLELLKGCPTNDGQPRKIKIESWARVDEAEVLF